MRSKRKACEKIVYIFPEETLQSMKSNPEYCDCIKYFEDINFSVDGIQQINLLKEVQNVLSLRQPEQLMESQPDIDILSSMFYQSPLKSSHKKTLSRIFQDLSDRNSKVVKTSLQSSLEFFLNTSLQKLSMKGVESCIDCLLGLLDNFTIGSSVIEGKLEIVWEYLSGTLTFIVNKFNKSHCTDLYSTCQSVLKAFILILQNCENIKTSLGSCKSEDFTVFSHSIVKAIESLLANDKTTLNCRLNAGIAICYYYFSLDPENFKTNLFSEVECSFHEIEKLPLSSQLCVFSGIMAALPIQEFVVAYEDKAVADKIIHKTLHISECVEDSDLLLLCARDLIQWSNVMCNALCIESKQPVEDLRFSKVKEMFQEDGSVMEMMFQYVLHYREHYVDTLRHLSKDLFKNILNLHILSIQVASHKSPLLKKMACYLLNDLPQHSQGKYGLLSCIVEIVGTPSVLQWYPLLPETLYNALKEVNLVSHVSDLLEMLFRKAMPIDDNDSFVHVWLKPLLKHLSSESKEQSAAMNEHVLPKLFKVRPYSLHFLLSELSTMWEQNRGNCFSAVITCVKFHQRQKLDKTVFDFISFESLTKALCHADDQVRLSAFALICENPKTTEPVSAESFELIKITLPFNINCQSPAFRQQLVSYMKKIIPEEILHDLISILPLEFFCSNNKSEIKAIKLTTMGNVISCLLKAQQLSMAESSYYLERRKQINDINIVSCFPAVKETYEAFLCWLKKYLYSCLYHGANFPRRVTALNLLSLLNSILSQLFCIVAEPAEAQTLLYALQDTYENNKIISLNILASCDSSLLQTQDEHYLESLFQTSLILASSAKPPDTVTAAYLFALIVQYESFDSLLQKHLSEQIKDGLCILTFGKEPPFKMTHSSSFTAILLLSGELLKHLKLAQKSLLDAAAHAPLYGVLACIRSILSQVDFRLLKDSDSLFDWCCLIQELIALSIKVASTVEPVVCNSSPEGHLPMDTNSGNIQQLQAAVRRAIGKRFQSAIVDVEEPSPEIEGVVLDMVKTHAVTAQILLLCCWRTHKEVSLLFGEIAEKIPIRFTENDNGNDILKISQIMDVGKYFIRQMTLVKHKGAFEQAYVGFSKLCHMLWRCSVKELQELPKVWLNDLILAIKGLKDNMQLCSTRRSAGLPFIVQALLTSEPLISNSSFFKDTVSSLLNMASVKSEDKSTDEQIHALNILRALYRDACLSDVLIPFISEGLNVSITGFKSQSWAVRNSSTLLFSALMTRIFGVNRSHDEAGKKNRLTGRTFFSYYKDTYSFLYNELEQCAAVLSKNQNSVSLVPTLYPILLILGRLYPAPGECDPRLVSFLPMLHVCASSSVWKVRVLAAKALVPLISLENIVSTLQSLFDSLSSAKSHNEIHGKCLQILYVLKECSCMAPDRRKSIEDSLQLWIQSHFDIAFKNKCYVTRASFLEIVLFSMTIKTALDSNLAKKMLHELLSEIRIISSTPDKEHYLCTAIVLSLLYLIQLEENELKQFLPQIDARYNSLQNLLADFLTSPCESVRCTALQFLVYMFQDKSVSHDFDLESSIHPVFFSSVFNSSVCLMIRKCKVLHKRMCIEAELPSLVLPMLSTEEGNSSCLGTVYQLLCLMPLAVELTWNFVTGLPNSCVCHKLEYVLSQLSICKRDDVSNHVLLFSTEVALEICEVLQEKYKGGDIQGSSKCNNCLSSLMTWTKIMEESAQPENCFSRRKVVVSALKLIFRPLVMEKLKVLGNCAVYLWQALLHLLIDDEPEIKQLSADIVISVRTSEKSERRTLPVVPSLALDYMMELFINEDVCCSSDYIGVLLNWILSCKHQSIDDTGDEQPFDRGELNVFAEDLLLTSLASKYLTQYLHSHSSETTLPISVDKVSSWKSFTNQSGDHFNTDKAVTLCLSEAEALVQRLLTRGAVSPLLDNHFDNDIVQICQRLHVILCFSSWVTFNFKHQGLDLLGNIRKIKCRTYFLEDLLSRFHAHLLSIQD